MSDDSQAAGALNGKPMKLEGDAATGHRLTIEGLDSAARVSATQFLAFKGNTGSDIRQGENSVVMSGLDAKAVTRIADAGLNFPGASEHLSRTV